MALKISGAGNKLEVYKTVKCHKNGPNYKLLVLQNTNGKNLAGSLQEKIKLLRNNLLLRHLETTDIPENVLTVATPSKSWTPIFEAEAYRATCFVSSTIPGDDEISVIILRAAWPNLECLFTNLFQLWIDLGAYPRNLKQVSFIILLKVGREIENFPIHIDQSLSFPF